MSCTRIAVVMLCVISSWTAKIIIQTSIIAFDPTIFTGVRIDQLNINSDPFAAFSNTAVEQITNLLLFGYGCYGCFTIFV